MRRSVLAGTTFIFAAAVVAASDVAASPSGYVYLAVGGGTLGSGCTDATPCPPHVRVFDAATGEVVVTIPLPSGAVPEGMALSHDGSHLYVSGRSATAGGAASLTVIDARHHTAIASYALGANDFGELAVRGNDSRVHIMGRSSPPMGTPVPPTDCTRSHGWCGTTWTASRALGVGSSWCRIPDCVRRVIHHGYTRMDTESSSITDARS